MPAATYEGKYAAWARVVEKSDMEFNLFAENTEPTAERG
jgi:hypothetical protein